mgnify:CR=1 FL=1
MKKTLAVVLSLLLVAMLSGGAALAKSDNGKGWGNTGDKKVTDTEKKPNPNQAKDQNPEKDQNQVKDQTKVKDQNQVKDQTKVKDQNQVKDQTKVKEPNQVKDQTKVKKSKPGESPKPQPGKKLRFSDTEQHWAHQCIEEMSACGLLKGYPDGSFKPDQPLTQAEALSLAMRVAPQEEVVDEDDTDIATDDSELETIPEWVRGDANKAAKKGIIKLNRFHSAVQASRAQTAVMIAKALGLEPVDTSNIPFKDGILLSPEDVGYILALYEEGIISGDPNGNFNPNSAITRAEMASLLQRLLEKAELSITLPETATVEQGQSITLKATVKCPEGSSDYTVTWESSDTTLATVEDGVVTAAADKTGTVNITAAVTCGEDSQTATCKVTVVEKVEVASGALVATGSVGSHAGKVYEEYVLKVDGQTVSLAQDNVKSITLQKDSDAAVQLTANTDSALWFNVQRATGKYTLTVVDNNDKSYTAVLDWSAPLEAVAAATGNQGEHDGNSYTEYKIGSLDLSSFTGMFQIKPDGQVIELTANSDTNLWFKTNDQVAGQHIFLIKKGGVWYSSSISI